jgi:Golgi phosphoprotein 3 GPP34
MMTSTLRETLFLLAHRPSGRPRIQNFVLEAGLAAAALMELRRLGALEVTGDGNVAVHGPAPTGDPLLDRLLHQLVGAASRPPHELVAACGGDVKQSVRAALVAHGLCRLDSAGYLSAVVPGRHRGDARDDLSSGQTSDLGALLWATELSGYVLGPTALVGRLRLGRQAAADPLALAVRQAFPLPAGALRLGSSGSNY